MSALTNLDELRKLLRQPISDEMAGKWWDLVMMVESEIERGRNHDAGERDLMRRVREKVSDVIAAWRGGAKSLPIASASVAVTALESHLRRGTIGTDGYPLG